MDPVYDRIENKERQYLLSFILLLLLTLKAFWFAEDFIINMHPGHMIFMLIDLLFRLNFF
jgi:hypothetical protein